MDFFSLIFFLILFLVVFAGPIALVVVIIVLSKKTTKDLQENGINAYGEVVDVSYTQSTPVYVVYFKDENGIPRETRMFSNEDLAKGELVPFRYVPPHYKAVTPFIRSREERKTQENLVYSTGVTAQGIVTDIQPSGRIFSYKVLYVAENGKEYSNYIRGVGDIQKGDILEIKYHVQHPIFIVAGPRTDPTRTGRLQYIARP